MAVLLLVAFLRPVSAHADDFGRVDGYVRAQMAKTGTPGLAYAILKEGRVAHQRFWGRDGDGRAVTEHTPFLYGSVAKSFTALAVMQLVEKGKVRLDDPVRRHLGWFRPSGPEPDRITVRHLLTQTSGISTRDGLSRADRFDNEQDGVRRLARELAEVRLHSAAGAEHTYSNANYMLLGALVEQVTGRPFSDHLRASVLSPLGMTDAIADAADASRLPPGHRFSFGRARAFDTRFDTSGVPYGYLGGSLADLSRFAAAQFTAAPVLSADGMRLVHAGAVPVGDSHRYALGWRDDAFEDLGTRMVWHSGATPGFHSIVILLPEQKTAIVVLQNAFTPMKDVLFNATGFGAARLLLGAEPEPAETDPAFAWLLAALTVVTVLLMVCVGWSAVRLVRPGTRRRTLTRGIGASSGCLVLAYGAGVLVPGFYGVDLESVRLFTPDVGLLLVATSVLAVLLAILRAALALRATVIARRTPSHGVEQLSSVGGR
jgi:CubicO group peptidase (beta-lactamase class C family)